MSRSISPFESIFVTTKLLDSLVSTVAIETFDLDWTREPAGGVEGPAEWVAEGGAVDESSMSNFSSSASSLLFSSSSSPSSKEDVFPSLAFKPAGGVDTRLIEGTLAGPSSTMTKLFCLSLSFHFSVLEMAWNQSVLCFSAQTVGKGYLEAVTLMWSPCLNSTRPLPSNEAHAVERELYGTQMRSSIVSGRSIGLNESVCGQIGLIRSAGISGCTNEPPAES